MFQNTPNDLQLLSDAPAHHIFVLLGPVDPNQSSLPEVLCVLQVWLSLVILHLHYVPGGHGSHVSDNHDQNGINMMQHGNGKGKCSMS